MRIRQMLQGRPFGHPIHPLIIHFPIGAFVLSFLLDLVAATGLTDWAADASFKLIGIGLIFGALAAIFGLADFLSLRRDSDARWIATQHAMLNAVVLFLYAAGLLVRYVENHQLTFVSFFFSAIAFGTLMY